MHPQRRRPDDLRLRRASLILAIALLAGPARPSSLFDYGMGMADARVPLGVTAFNIWVHKKRPTFLLQPAMKTIMGGGGHWPDPVWLSVAEAFVQPIGCGISEIRPLSRSGASWEATYACPAGVDLIGLVAAQRAELKHGQQLHRADGSVVPPPIVERKPLPVAAAEPAAPPVVAPAAAPAPEPPRCGLLPQKNGAVRLVPC